MLEDILYFIENQDVYTTMLLYSFIKSYEFISFKKIQILIIKS